MKKAVLLITVILLLLLCSCGADGGKEAETTPIDANTTGALETRAQVFYTKNVRIDPSDPYSVIIKERCEEFRKIGKRMMISKASVRRALTNTLNIIPMFIIL